MNKNFFKIGLSLLFALLSSLSASAYDFASHSLLSSGRWVKIRVAENGICKLTYEQLSQMGFSSPSEVRVFGYGGAVLNENLYDAKPDDLNEVPLYAGANYFLFYAQGPNQWSKSTETNLPLNLTVNPYSFYGYYFLTDNAGTKKRIEYRKENENTSHEYTHLRHFLDRKCHKKQEFNYINSGKNWYGDKFASGEIKTINLNFGTVDTSKNATLHFVTAFSPSDPNTVVENLTIGDSTIVNSFTLSRLTGHTKAIEKTYQLYCKPTAPNFSVSVVTNSNISSDNGSIERVVALCYRPLTMKNNGNPFYFRDPEASSFISNFIYHVGGCNANTQIWDISDRKNPARVATTLEKDTLTFIDYDYSTIREFVAINVDDASYISAEYVGPVSNQDLHGLSNPDLVIITHPNFMEGAERLARLHEEYDNMTVHIVTPEQIYNEYSSGTPDATAIRWFMKQFYQRNGGKPFYLQLIGDGCFDNRGILSANNTVNNFIITYQGGSYIDESYSYASDDYFTFLDDSEINNGKVSSAKMDICIGRIPCATSDELNGYINKVEEHLQNKSYGKWKNKICLLADDNEGVVSSTPSNTSKTDLVKFFDYSERISKMAHNSNPAMETKKIYLDAYNRTTGANGSRYYDIESLLKEEISEGIMIMNYIGHSSKIGFSSEHVFTQNTARTIYNKNCGFWFTASCEFNQFDDLTRSGGEDLILNPNGGAIVLVSSTRVVYDVRNDNLNQALFKHIFLRDEDNLPLRFGEIYRLTKASLAGDDNRMAYNYMGDPTLRLHYPDMYVTTDSILSEDHVIDTLNALSTIQLCGHIIDKDSLMVNDFNGPLYVTLYDKEISLYTKANCFTEESDILKYRYEYKDRPNVLFSGQVEVTNGYFKCYIKLPKDINYSFGYGRIAYYGYDETNGYEAQGAKEDFYIGGSCDYIDPETDGPEVSLFMNTESFQSGETVNGSPVFFAVVSDPNGINASGCGIGHDITLTLNGSSTPIVLNNYFSYSKNSYTSGVVKYQLSDLEDGSYTLTFKVWDLLNNSTTQSINFVVDNSKETEVEELIVYPNPAKESITFLVTHDAPQTIQNFRFLVYDIYGKLVYQSEEIASKNDGELSWEWDLTTATGRRVDAGCYVARVEILIDEEKYTGKSKKIIVLPQ